DLSIDGLIENPATVEPVTGSGPNEFDPFSTPLVDVIPLPEPIPARAQNTVPVLAWVEADGAPADEDGSTFDPFNDYETLNRAKRFILEECQGKGHEATNKARWWEFRQNFWSEMGPSGYLGQRLRLVEL